jgi:hypothetical protein
MKQNITHPRRNHLQLTHHSRLRLAERDLHRALGAIAMIAYDTRIARTSINDEMGRREEIMVDGITIIVSAPNANGVRSLITVYPEYDDSGAQVYQRLRHYLEHRVDRTRDVA